MKIDLTTRDMTLILDTLSLSLKDLKDSGTANEQSVALYQTVIAKMDAALAEILERGHNEEDY